MYFSIKKTPKVKNLDMTGNFGWMGEQGKREKVRSHSQDERHGQGSVATNIGKEWKHENGSITIHCS